MTKGYTLLPSESMVFPEETVSTDEFGSGNTLIFLTNQNIVVVKQSMWGKVKDTLVFPIDHVKIFNGQPQAIVTKGRNSSVAKLDVYFTNDQLSVNFQSLATANKFVRMLNRLVTGAEDIIVDGQAASALPKSEQIAAALKDTIDTFKGTFDRAPKAVTERSSRPRNERTTAHCSGCGASLSGLKGRVVTCEYCGTSNQL
ncbi:hypothetical protein [Lacticaseibacillus kribbianus]|uniref:hypothetical protein n=1 Tax=Lacticaseibacillus kribbianus TaxID=2926292 RepID=UPI001CD328BE|nr:hypothetical protein [Lacticaseibacillus kribbianus]